MIIDKSSNGGLLQTSEAVLDRVAYPEINLPSSVSQEPLVLKSCTDFDAVSPYPDDKSDVDEKLNSLEHSSSDTRMISNSPSNGDEELCKCGWWSMRPNFLQRFNSPKWVLAFLCMSACLQGLIVNGFVNVVITSIERRFEIKSTDSGVIAGSYDIGTLICLIPVTYFGGHASKPLLIGSGMIIAGLGSFIFSLPHFTTESYTFSVAIENICMPNNATSCVTPGLTSLSNYKYVFFFGQFLHGVGYSPLYTLGITYIDESVSTKMSSVYLGIFYLMSVIGPALGYVVGGQLLKIYTDFYAYNAESIGLTVSSNLWVGSWWLGFLIAAVLAFFVGIPLTLFPKELPETKKLRMNKVSETHEKTENSVATQTGFGIAIKDLPKSLKILITNPTFVFTSFAGAVEAFLLAALSTFMPKYIEAQFNIMPSWAAFLIGLITVLGAGSGMIMGGYLIKRLKLKCRGILKFCCIGAGVSLSLLFVFVIRCEIPPFAGVSIPYMNISENVVCNSECGCLLSDYDPICGTDGINYYSPCFAGCKIVYKTQISKAYSNCSCISGDGRSMKLNGQDIIIHAEREKCASDCYLLPVFLTILFFCMFFTFVIVTPSLQVTLRCVAESQRSFALGVQWIFMRILGSIPGPMVVGALIDRSCNLWQQLCDGSYGSCQSYDNYRLSVTMGIIAFITKLLSVSMFIIALYSYKPPKNVPSSMPHVDGNGIPPPNSATVTTICGKLNAECNVPINGLNYKVISDNF